MATHVKTLGVIHTIFGALGLFGAIVVLVIFGGLAGLAGTAQEPDTQIAAPILGGIGGLISVVVVVFSLPGLITGIGLLQFRSWARTLGIVVSAVSLLGVPFGTALGIYGLWVLLNRETEPLFAGRGVAGVCKNNAKVFLFCLLIPPPFEEWVCRSG